MQVLGLSGVVLHKKTLNEAGGVPQLVSPGSGTFLKEERRGWHLWGRGSTAVLKVCQVKALLGYPGTPCIRPPSLAAFRICVCRNAGSAPKKAY